MRTTITTLTSFFIIPAAAALLAGCGSSSASKSAALPAASGSSTQRATTPQSGAAQPATAAPAVQVSSTSGLPMAVPIPTGVAPSPTGSGLVPSAPVTSVNLSPVSGLPLAMPASATAAAAVSPPTSPGGATAPVFAPLPAGTPSMSTASASSASVGANTPAAIPYVPIAASPPPGQAISPQSPSATAPPARSPAPNRRIVKTRLLPIPGLREIPDNAQFDAYFAESVDASALSVGDTFTVAAAGRKARSFGPVSHIGSGGLPDGALLEFRVTRKSPSGDRALVRATYILIQDPDDASTDIAIPLATASLLPPDLAGPLETSRFEAARRGDDVGSAVGMLGTNSTHAYFLFGALGKAIGYSVGRMRETAAGNSFLAGDFQAGTECVVRVNRRVLF